PGDFNLRFPEYGTETVQLIAEQDISISELSICIGQLEPHDRGWFRTLRNLNPRLDPGQRVRAGETIEIPAILLPVYREKCLSGNLIEEARLLHDANYPDVLTYVVASGDTLGEIAARFRCATAAQIAALNDIRAPGYLIRPGQVLQIPQCK
ncbi:MAG: LysM peptidoglycan-binding domain-containing protein, partial [Acidobacteria bacterium]|nr:LysM peptidoglycan-binding domain-containing protein [Acidobacteriota bacterium]